MDDKIKETEIKIEYWESNETDPLSGNSEIINLGNNRVGQNVSILLENNKNYEHKIECNLKANELGADKYTIKRDEANNYVNSLDQSINNRLFVKEMVTKKETTWYKIIDESGMFLCKYCDLKYSTVQTLRYHVKMKHPDEANNLSDYVKNNKRNPKIKCHICKKKFEFVTNLTDHVNECHTLENIQSSCNFCDATFNNIKEIAEHHFYKHGNVLRNKTVYSCAICGYRTAKKSHYHQHINTHSSKKNKKCQYCNYATNYLPNLKTHERIHKNDKPYICDFENCDYRSAAKSALLSHQLKHNPEKNMLFCDKCSYKTVYKQSLKKHVDSHRRNRIKSKPL